MNEPELNVGNVGGRDDPDVEPLHQFLKRRHDLPEELRLLGQRYGQLADDLLHTFIRGPERTVALRKLLESRDAALRAELRRWTQRDDPSSFARPSDG